VAKDVFGKETKLAMRPIKQKKRRYYATVFFLVVLIIGGMIGFKVYSDYTSNKAFNEAMATMDASLTNGDYASLAEAEKVVADLTGETPPRVQAVGHTVLLRCLIWKVFTGEAMLISDSRKLVAFLAEPYEDDEGNVHESPYKDDPMTHLVDAVFDVMLDEDEEATKAGLATLSGIDAGLLAPGEKEFWLGMAFWSQGDMVKAEAQMRASVAAADNPHHRFGLARVLTDAGKAEEAKAEYTKVVETNPAHIAAQGYLMLLQMTPEQDAVGDIKTFINETHQGKVPARVASDMTLVMAATLCAKGEEGKAKKAIHQAKMNDPNYSLLMSWAPPAPPVEEGEEGEEKK